MAMNPRLWQEMFTLDTIPMCDEGMKLAEVFFATCGHAVENATVLDEGQHVMARWKAISKHASTCGKCREV